MFAPLFVAAELQGPGQLPSPPFRLEYIASQACPSRAEFIDSVTRRLAEAPTATSEGPALAFRVELEQSGELTAGRLYVRSEGETGEVPERVVPPAPCAAVAESLAVMMALMLDGRAAPTNGAVASAQHSSAGAAAAPAMHAPAAASSRDTFEAPKAERSERSESLRFGGVAAVGAEAGPASSRMPALSFGAAVQLPRDSIWAPSGRIQLVYGEAHVAASEGGVVFRLLTSRLSVCPVQVRVSSVQANACATVDAGTLRASGADGTLWLAAGAALRIELAVARFLELEADFDARVPAFHDRFVLQSSHEPLHQVPPLAESVSIGVSAWAM